MSDITKYLKKRKNDEVDVDESDDRQVAPSEKKQKLDDQSDLSDEQLQKIAQNRQIALEKRKARAAANTSKSQADEEATTSDDSTGVDALETLMPADWRDVFADKEFKKPYFASIKKFLKAEKQEEAKGNTKIFPPMNKIFTAFTACHWDNIKVVIIGQDPYHGPNQAHGLCFSVEGNVPVPPSLKNIYKELTTDIDGFVAPKHGNLLHWANQGVLMLNAVLTVRQKTPNAHKGKGWEQFTDAAIDAINTHKEGVVFLLWGGDAQKKGSRVNTKKHLVLKSGHPSPLSVNKFLNNHHFSKCNGYLEKNGKTPIDWTLSNK